MLLSFRILFVTDFHNLQCGRSSAVKAAKNGRHIGIHSEHKRGITERIHIRKPNRTFMRFTFIAHQGQRLTFAFFFSFKIIFVVLYNSLKSKAGKATKY